MAWSAVAMIVLSVLLLTFFVGGDRSCGEVWECVGVMVSEWRTARASSSGG